MSIASVYVSPSTIVAVELLTPSVECGVYIQCVVHVGTAFAEVDFVLGDSSVQVSYVGRRLPLESDGRQRRIYGHGQILDRSRGE